jgi:hypothetical protein
MPVIDDGARHHGSVYLAVLEAIEEEIALLRAKNFRVPPVLTERLAAMLECRTVECPDHYLPDSVRPPVKTGQLGMMATVSPEGGVLSLRIEDAREGLREIGEL